MNPRLRTHLLSALNASGAFALTVDQILEAGEGAWTRSEVENELRKMEADGLVVTGRNPVGKIKYLLTASGQAACAELKL